MRIALPSYVVIAVIYDAIMSSSIIFNIINKPCVIVTLECSPALEYLILL